MMRDNRSTLFEHWLAEYGSHLNRIAGIQGAEDLADSDCAEKETRRLQEREDQPGHGRQGSRSSK